MASLIISWWRIASSGIGLSGVGWISWVLLQLHLLLLSWITGLRGVARLSGVNWISRVLLQLWIRLLFSWITRLGGIYVTSLRVGGRSSLRLGWVSSTRVRRRSISKISFCSGACHNRGCSSRDGCCTCSDILSAITWWWCPSCTGSSAHSNHHDSDTNSNAAEWYDNSDDNTSNHCTGNACGIKTCKVKILTHNMPDLWNCIRDRKLIR